MSNTIQYKDFLDRTVSIVVTPRRHKDKTQDGAVVCIESERKRDFFLLQKDIARALIQELQAAIDGVEIKCFVCGDWHEADNFPLSCQTGDGL